MGIRLWGVAPIIALGLFLGTAPAFGATAPEIVWLGGKEGEVEGSVKGKAAVWAELNTPSGAIKSEGLYLDLRFENALLGKFTFEYLASKLGANKCNTTGAPAEDIILTGKYRTVFLKTAPLVAGILYPIAETTITCGAIKVKLRGELLSEIPITGKFDLETTFPKIKCVGAGVNEFTKYINEKNEEVKNQNLETSIGLGFEQACQEAETATLKWNVLVEIKG